MNHGDLTQVPFAPNGPVVVGSFLGRLASESKPRCGLIAHRESVVCIILLVHTCPPQRHQANDCAALLLVPGFFDQLKGSYILFPGPLLPCDAHSIPAERTLNIGDTDRPNLLHVWRPSSLVFSGYTVPMRGLNSSQIRPEKRVAWFLDEFPLATGLSQVSVASC